jgi:sRNA-binding carbon storage regulator CsrA
VKVITITNLVREVGEQIILVTPSGQVVVVTILDDDRIGIEAPEGVEVNIEDLT